MAQIADKISQLSVNDDPSVDGDYEERAGPINTSLIEAVSGADDPLGTGQIWRVRHSSGGTTTIIDPTIAHADIEILALMRRPSNSPHAPKARVPTSSGTTGYSGGMHDGNGGEQIAVLRPSMIASTDPGFGTMVSEWMWVRFRLNGVNPTAYEVTAWEFGTSEPSPQISGTDSDDVEDAGHPGFSIGVSTAAAYDVAYLSVGTAGDVAPAPGGGGDPTTILPMMMQMH